MSFTLTDNEFKASMILVKACLENMGGKRPSDLEYDKFVWVNAKDLMNAGYSRHEATGTFGALMEKGIVSEYDRNEWILTDDAWRWLDTVWAE